MAVHASPTRFMVLSDTHNFEEDPSKPFPLSQETPKVDVVLHCGDLTQVGGLSAYKKALKMFEQFDAELKLVIAGNHDLSLDGEYWKTHLEEDDEPEEHDEAVEIMTRALAKKANVTYLTEGLYEFTLKSGSKFSIFVSPYQPEFGDWAFGYPRNSDRWSIPENVDIVMTHGPPHGILDFGHGQNFGCESLLKAVARARPLMHCFGHIHEGYGAVVSSWDARDADEAVDVSIAKAGDSDATVQQNKLAPGHETLMVNAAIMDEKKQPSNAPWIIDLPIAASDK
ncbi:hypothetical protein M409DRAFT_59036 [Zasmidium cellare ATCC 36951]|uniref:Calcineurin-like phosphoesterase domain-containing protein n=1 Tax=Zasmidium cellare ATCC 36951 TaxID=1080233 RepID=A0A6A6C3Q6_ZASCE|nr:uncharacterized protein M409DRAFT_59036 [Zasmidium cellare ATCC 36951]KAF2161655.1 hypothetical protein M409DRAFT_59036 [Zasmidium cellare ATCC 36951]